MTPKQIGYYPRVSLAFARKGDTELITFSKNVVALMTANTNYPTPSPGLAAVTAAIDAYETAVREALDGGKLLIGTRNALRESLLVLLRKLAAYVTGNCNDDVLTLQGAGFDAVRTPSAVGLLAAPQNLRLEYTGMSGELLLRFKGESNTRNYSVECSLSVDGPWIDKGLSTTQRVLLDSLIPGKNYWARVCANGSAGSSEWSVPTTIMAV